VSQKARGYIVLAIILIGGLYLLSRRAEATTLAEAQAAGWLPMWLTADDRYRVIGRKEGTTNFQYHCIEDSTTKAQWVLRTRRGAEREFREGRLPITLTMPKVPVTPAQIAVCFTAPPPPPSGPVAAGEPAYWLLRWDASQYPDSPNFGQMNLLDIAGTTTVNEPCGESVGNGFFLLPRLTRETVPDGTGGTVAMTRCVSP